jgi:anti-sigma factor RsiW
METREISEVLLAYCGRRLDPGTATALERHLESCPACREAYAGQRTVWKALDAWEAVPVPEDFDRRLYRRIDEEERRSWWRRPLGLVLVHRGLPVMAAACLLVVAGALLDHSRTPAPFSGDVRAEAVQADQVERTLEDMELLQGFNQAPM